MCRTYSSYAVACTFSPGSGYWVGFTELLEGGGAPDKIYCRCWPYCSSARPNLEKRSGVRSPSLSLCRARRDPNVSSATDSCPFAASSCPGSRASRVTARRAGGALFLEEEPFRSNSPSRGSRGSLYGLKDCRRHKRAGRGYL